MSTLRENLSVLYELQLLDNENMDNMRQLRKLERFESETFRTYKSFKTQIEKMEKKLQPMKAQSKEFDDKLSMLEQKKKQCEEKLYDADTSQKELIFLQKEREQINSLQKTSEEERGKLQYEIENIERVVEEVRGQMTQIEPKVNEEREKAQADAEGIRRRIEELKEKRLEFRNFENKDLLRMYQNIQRENGGLAIVPMVEGACEGCGIEAPVSTLQKLEVSENIVRCQSCGRILFEPEPSPA